MSSTSGSPSSVSSTSASTVPPTWSPDDLPEELRAAIDAALDKKALAPAVLRVTDVAGYTDWVVILSARSERQVAAIADAISRALKGLGRPARGTDGFDGHQWDLLDYDDFIVHVFHHPVRTHFDLESMWSDAPRVELGLPHDVMDTSGLDDVFAAAPPSTDFRGDNRFGGYDDEFEDDDEDDDEDYGWDDELETKADAPDAVPADTAAESEPESPPT